MQRRRSRTPAVIAVQGSMGFTHSVKQRLLQKSQTANKLQWRASHKAAVGRPPALTTSASQPFLASCLAVRPSFQATSISPMLRSVCCCPLALCATLAELPLCKASWRQDVDITIHAAAMDPHPKAFPAFQTWPGGRVSPACTMCWFVILMINGLHRSIAAPSKTTCLSSG